MEQRFGERLEGHEGQLHVISYVVPLVQPIELRHERDEQNGPDKNKVTWRPDNKSQVCGHNSGAERVANDVEVDNGTQQEDAEQEGLVVFVLQVLGVDRHRDEPS